MADYSRIVSYMYNYENGAKKSNIGYARVETRNGQCKITIHIKVPSLADQLLGAYIIHRGDDHMQGVRLGNVQIKNGVGEYQVNTVTDNLMNSNYRFDEMGAIVVYSSDQKFFGTEWDDKPIVMRDFEVITNKANARKPDDRKEEVIVEAAPLNQGISNLITEEEPIAHIEKAMVEEVNQTPQAIREESKEELVSVDTVISSQAIRKEPFGESRSSIFSEAQQRLIFQAQLLSLFGMPVRIPEEPKQEVKEEVLVKEDLSGGAIEPDESVKKKEDCFVKIFEKFPKMYPFEDDEVVECVKFEPQDIGMLPMDNWILGNNSFLMHGYYSYRHLILAKLRQARGFQYVIGVPGININREQFMARMFGFDRFKSIKRNEPAQGEFGYYYMSVMK